MKKKKEMYWSVFPSEEEAMEHIVLRFISMYFCGVCMYVLGESRRLERGDIDLVWLGYIIWVWGELYK